MNASIPATEVFDVEFPAVVNNVDKAISMLGGEEGIYEVFSNPKRSLSLMFRPDMFYCKPATGDSHPVKALALKIQRCHNKETGEIRLFVSILGRIVKMYQFKTFADFQYGPFERIYPPTQSTSSTTPDQLFPSTTTKLSEYNVFYDKLLIREPTTLIDPHLAQDLPLFIPPANFCRYDHCITYNFAPRYRTTELIELEEKHKLPAVRKPRPSYSIVINPGEPAPAAAHPEALDSVLRLGATGENSSEHYRKLFERRPIWLTPALRYETPQETKTVAFHKILRAQAYHIHRGPWARAWIRFGYDPQEDPEARFYQVIDFRLQSFKVIKKLLKHSLIRQRLIRENNVKKISSSKTRSSRRISESNMADDAEDGDLTQEVDDNDDDEAGDADDDDDNLDSDDGDNEGDEEEEEDEDDNNDLGPKGMVRKAHESEFIFGPNHLPSGLQVRYCLIDVQIPEVQAIVAEKPERTEIDPVDGWLKPGSMRQIRTLMAQYLKKWITANRIIEAP